VITTGAEVMDQIFRPKQRRGNAATATGSCVRLVGTLRPGRRSSIRTRQSEVR
jgi:hypothetical protein